jgi:hypothetical protein
MEIKNSTWTEQEKEFQRQREDLTRSIDMVGFLDQPALFAKRQTVTGMISRYHLFREVLEVQGSIIECGVHKGNNLMWFYHLACILEPMAFNRKIYGFDTFEGFRSLSTRDAEILDEGMFADANFDVLTRAIAIHDLNRPLAHIPKCQLIRGDATRTIPDFCSRHPELIVALLYLDFDIYEPTKVALQHLMPLVPKGGVIVFDELNSGKWKGETEALKELLKLDQIKLRRLPFDPWPSYFVVGE